MNPLILADKIFRAWGRDKPPSLPRNNAFESALWNLDIPGVKDYIPAVLEFSRTKEISLHTGSIKIGSGTFQNITPTSAGINVEYTFGSKQNEFIVPYPSQQFKDLCRSGDWVDYGYIQVRSDAILPTIFGSNNAATLTWKSPIQVRARGWFKMNLIGRLTTTSLSQITITPEVGYFTTRGIGSIAIPELRWT